VSSTNCFQVIFVEEFVTDVLTPTESCATGGRGEASFTLICWVGPQKVTEGTRVWNILHSIDASELVHSFDLRREAAMQAEELILDGSSNRKALEEICEHFPN
jgi:hypothetical protein